MKTVASFNALVIFQIEIKVVHFLILPFLYSLSHTNTRQLESMRAHCSLVHECCSLYDEGYASSLGIFKNSEWVG